MSNPLDQLTIALRLHGQSVTAARKTVFLALLDKEPQSMRDIVAACGHSIDRASVYRTITLFESLGIVQRLQIGWKYKLELSDAFHRHHHHLTCLRCGHITPLAEDAHLEQHLRDAAERHGFVMQGHQLEIQGLCLTCQDNSI